MRRDVVTRISKANHDRLKKITGESKMPLNERVEMLLDMVERFQEGELVYLAGNRFFYDQAEAMGEAIVDFVKNKTELKAPMIATIIGKVDENP